MKTVLLTYTDLGLSIRDAINRPKLHRVLSCTLVNISNYTLAWSIPNAQCPTCITILSISNIKFPFEFKTHTHKLSEKHLNYRTIWWPYIVHYSAHTHFTVFISNVLTKSTRTLLNLHNIYYPLLALIPHRIYVWNHVQCIVRTISAISLQL